MIKVIYWNNQPAPYFVDRLNAVADRGNVEIEAWFDGVRESDRSWEVDASTWRFTSKILNVRTDSLLRGRVPSELLARSRPDLLIANYDRLHMIYGVLVASRYAKRTALRTLPTFDAWSKSSHARECARRLVFHAVDGAKVPGPDGAAFARRYGMPTERIWPVKQAITVADYSGARALPDHERKTRRAALGLDDRCTFVYVGRIWRGKGLETLLDAFGRVCLEADAQLLLVGDGPDEEHFRTASSDLEGVRWAGFVQPPDLPAIYALCDVFVFPTLGDPNGLVVEEAMASGLPVISSTEAGDIRRRVPEGEAGYVVPPGDAEALAARMLTMIRSPAKRMRMAKLASQIAESFTPEQFAKDFERFVHEILKMPRRRSLVRFGARLLPPTGLGLLSLPG